MTEQYVCPYCGKEVGKDEVLFWETVKTQYTDNIRGDFLRHHGVRISAGNKFPRVYYKVKPGINVTREDKNGFPTMLDESLDNALAPEDLNRLGNSGEKDDFDDDFDAEEYDDYGEEWRNDRKKREKHNVPMRACPHCHCELPQQFGVLKTFHVAMFGGRAAGKTAYLGNLFQQLHPQHSQLDKNNLGSVDLAAESRAFLEPLIADYERDGTFPPTPADRGLLPILCHYCHGADEAFITFYDIAGEGTGNPEYMANHKGIACSELLMLMVDPNMFVSGAYYAEWNANHQESDNYHSDQGDCCKESLASFLNQAGELCKEYSENIKYVIGVVTKMDMLLESKAKFFGAGDVEVISDTKEKHREAVDYRVLKRVNDNLSVFLEKQHHVNLKSRLIETFGTDVKTIILGVSTSTLSQERSGKGEIHFVPDSQASASKHRIIEPFLAVLMYCGLVNVRMPDGRIIRLNLISKEAEQQNKEASEAEKGKNGKEEKRGLLGWRKNK